MNARVPRGREPFRHMLDSSEHVESVPIDKEDVTMKVKHCWRCNGTGKLANLSTTHESYIDCYECDATGHIVEVVHIETVKVAGVNPHRVIDHDSCSGYKKHQCEQSPCPDCDLDE
jgi:hypothetical protein